MVESYRHISGNEFLLYVNIQLKYNMVLESKIEKKRVCLYLYEAQTM